MAAIPIPVLKRGVCHPYYASGKLLPVISDLMMILPFGAPVRDMFGWHIMERSKGVRAVPSDLRQLYEVYASHGLQIILTLGTGNPLYGDKPMQYPRANEPDAIKAFVDYAVWAVTEADIPNLCAVSLLNEVNGSWGIGTVTEEHTDYAALANPVLTAVRAAAPHIKVILGASVGVNIDGWFTNTKVDWNAADFIDVHPYMGEVKLPQWHKQVAHIRSRAGVTVPMWLTEWGGPAAFKEGPDYIEWAFGDTGLLSDRTADLSVGGANYFGLYTSHEWKAGLFEKPGGALTAFGKAFVDAQQ